MRRARVRDCRRGAAMVEMALVLPIFLMIVLGIVEFGRAMMVSQLVTNAAREAARLAIVGGSTNTEVQQHINEFLSESVDVDAADVSVTITITPATGNPNPGNQIASSNTRDLIAIRVSVPFTEVSFIPGDFLEGTNLVGRASMRRE